LFRSGAQWWIDASDEVAREKQEARRQADSWEEKIGEFVAQHEEVTIGQVLQSCLGIEPAHWDRALQSRVGRCLHALGFYVHQRRVGRVASVITTATPRTQMNSQLPLSQHHAHRHGMLCHHVVTASPLSPHGYYLLSQLTQQSQHIL
jgi:predicted P-loop ATPase